VAYATVQGDLAAISSRWRFDPQRKAALQSQVIADVMAVLRTRAAPSKAKRHVEAALMRAIIEQHDKSSAVAGSAASTSSARSGTSWLDARNVLLAQLMMAGMLRESEAVELRVEDVEVKAVSVQGASGAAADQRTVRTLQVFIAKSKTDKAKEGAVVIIGEDSGNPQLCPVERFLSYRASVQAAGIVSDFLFPSHKGQQLAPTTPCSIVQRLVEAANRVAEQQGRGPAAWGDPMEYGSHSLRRGGVSAARANGVSMLDIQRHGRWKSLTVFSYVGTTVAGQLAVTRAFLSIAQGERVVDIPESNIRRAVEEGMQQLADKEQAKLQAAILASPAPPRLGAAAEFINSSGAALRAATASTPSPQKRGLATPSKRKHKADSDDEGPTAEEVEAERVEDEIFAAAMSQGYGDESEESAPKHVQPRSGRGARMVPLVPQRQAARRATEAQKSASPKKKSKQLKF
jgi:integrase